METKVYKMKWEYRFLFGKYKGKSVEEVKNMGVFGKSYIAWVYYEREDTTFSEDIISYFNLKPYNSKNQLLRWNNDNLTEEERKFMAEYLNNCRMGGYNKMRGYKKRYKNKVEENISKQEALWQSKASNAWRNQGH